MEGAVGQAEAGGGGGDVAVLLGQHRRDVAPLELGQELLLRLRGHRRRARVVLDRGAALHAPSPAQRSQLLRDGFLVVPNFLPLALLPPLRERVPSQSSASFRRPTGR